MELNVAKKWDDKPHEYCLHVIDLRFIRNVTNKVWEEKEKEKEND